MAFRDLLKNLDVPYSLNESNSEQRTESRNLSLATCFTVLKINFLKKNLSMTFQECCCSKKEKPIISGLWMSLIITLETVILWKPALILCDNLTLCGLIISLINKGNMMIEAGLLPKPLKSSDLLFCLPHYTHLTYPLMCSTPAPRKVNT